MNIDAARDPRVVAAILTIGLIKIGAALVLIEGPADLAPYALAVVMTVPAMAVVGLGVTALRRAGAARTR